MPCTTTNVFTLSSQPSLSFPTQPKNIFRRLFASPRPRFCVCMSAASTPTSSPVVKVNVLPAEEVNTETKRWQYLLEKTREKLSKKDDSVEKLKLIDTIQRLGIGYYLEDDIIATLQDQSDENDLLTTSLRFRLLRHNGLQASADVFLKFMDENRKFRGYLSEDKEGLLSLYEASYLGAKGEDILDEAKAFAELHVRILSDSDEDVLSTLEVPRHLRMERLESQRFIQRYAKLQTHDPLLLELAKLDYNRVQAQHQTELTEIIRWWKQLGLVEKLSFARDRPLECFLWSVGLLPDPKYSSCRIELAKTIAILLVIDDIFDTYGKRDDLVLFTSAIQRWDLEAMEELPEYMKICYMALYNTTNEICYKVLKENGLSVLPYLKSVWIDAIECFMVEASWFDGGSSPCLEEYIENGVSTAGAYMALVHLFFLIGRGVNDDNARFLTKKPYPKLFSAAGRILRLWDDLGTAKEEQERGDLASSIRLLMMEKKLESEEEGRECILGEIRELWKDLNGELIERKGMPLDIVKVAINMARASQVVYNHEEDTYFSSVDNYVEALFFAPLV